MEELIKRLRDSTYLQFPAMALKAADALEAQQARIAELDSALDACLSGKRIPVAVTNRTDDLSALAAHDAEITSKYIHLLSDQNYEYNQKTNALIKRHVEQLVKVRKAALLEATENTKETKDGTRLGHAEGEGPR